jgi:hypothetical protein
MVAEIIPLYRCDCYYAVAFTYSPLFIPGASLYRVDDEQRNALDDTGKCSQ